MIESAGNDIIDLAAINAKRTKEERFYKKFITGTEASLYSQPQLATLPFEHFVWMLWSIKESVYKFVQRHQPGLVFSPSKIVATHILPPACQSSKNTTSFIEATGFDENDTYQSKVEFAGDLFYARSIITAGYIHTVANNQNSFSNINWGVKCIPQTDTASQSAQVRAFALNKLASVLKEEGLSIVKSPTGCPLLVRGTTVIKQPVSLAHHGHYVAYTFPQNNVQK